MMQYKIAVVEDHPVVLTGLINLINKAADHLKVCASASTLKDAFVEIDKNRPHLVVMDLSLKGILAIQLIQKVHQNFPEMKILVLSVYVEPVFVKEALQAGANGYLSKEESTEQILKAITSLLEGQDFLSPAMTASKTTSDNSYMPQKLHLVAKLSSRELQVLNSLGRGNSLQEIAFSTGLSSKTIETYLTRIKRKCGLANRQELLQFSTLWYLKSQPDCQNLLSLP